MADVKIERRAGDIMQQQWIGRSVAKRILRVGEAGFEKLLARGGLSVQQIEGLPPRYRRDEIEQLFERSIRPGTLAEAATN